MSNDWDVDDDNDVNNARSILNSDSANLIDIDNKDSDGANHDSIAGGLSFTMLSPLAPNSPLDSSLPIAASTPNKLFTSRFSSSPLGLGLSYRSSVTPFHFASSDFFRTLRSGAPPSDGKSSPVRGLMGALDIVGVVQSAIDDADIDDNLTSSSDGARHDAERIAKLTSRPPPALISPKSAEPLPSFLQPRTHNKSKNSPLTSPSQSPTPAERSGSSSRNSLRYFDSSPTRGTDRSKREPFSPIHRYFIPPNARLMPEKERSHTDPVEPKSPDFGVWPSLSSMTEEDDAPTADPDRRGEPNSSPPHVSPTASLQNVEHSKFGDAEGGVVSPSPIHAYSGASQSPKPKAEGRLLSPRKILRDLSRCMSSPPRFGVDISQHSQNVSSRSPVDTAPLTKDNYKTEAISAGQILSNLEVLNMEMQETKREFDNLEKKIASLPDLDNTAESVNKSKSKDLEGGHEVDFETILSVNPEKYALVQFLVQILKLVMAVLLLFFALSGVILAIERQSMSRPYVGPEIALGRRW